MEPEYIIRSVPLNQQIYEYMKKKIIYGEIKCGDKIVETVVAKEMGVSRSPVREALRMLNADGLLVETKGGLIVNPMDDETAKEVYECRIVMDPFATGRAAERIDEETLAELKECLETVEKLRGAHTESNYKKIIEANSKFHALIIYACGPHQIRRYVEKNMALMSLVRFNEFVLYHQNEEYIDDHREIYEALAEHNAKRAEEVMRAHAIHDYEFFLAQRAAKNKDIGNLQQ